MSLYIFPNVIKGSNDFQTMKVVLSRLLNAVFGW